MSPIYQYQPTQGATTSRLIEATGIYADPCGIIHPFPAKFTQSARISEIVQPSSTVARSLVEFGVARSLVETVHKFPK